VSIVKLASQNQFLARSKLLILAIGLLLVLLIYIGIGLARPTFGFLPGVPSEPSAIGRAFDAAYWPEFYSGIVSGVITGFVVSLLVGGFLLFAEQEIEARHRLEEQQDALRRFRNGVILRARDSEWTEKVPARATETMPRNAIEIDKLYSESPVLDWLKIASNEDGFFRRLMSFSTAAKAFRQDAKKLDNVLEVKVRNSNFSAVHPVYDEFADSMIQYFLAKILGRDMEKALLFIQPSGIHTGELELTYLKLSEDHEVREATVAYLSATTRLTDSLVGLAGEPTSLPW